MNNPLKWPAWTLLIVVACWLFRTSDHQAAHWRGAYFSMAANLTPTGLFLVDTAEINRFDQLPAIGQTAYRFHRSPAHQRTEYRLTQVGYGYICALARRLWPFVGDGQAVVVLQVVVHIGCCLWLLWLLPTGWRRFVFLIGYACNPFIIKYVTYDFYYFWQVIPSVLLVATYLGWHGPTYRPGWRAGLWVGPLVGFLFITRPGMVGALLSLGGFWAYNRRPGILLVAAGLAIGVAALLYRPVQSAPWRPLYVGVAAYPNPYMNNLSDMAIYDLYKARTGQEYRYGNSDAAQEKKLMTVLQNEVNILWKKSPGLFLRNALLNVLLTFSTGYVTGGGWLNYGLALLGLLVLGWLLWHRRYVFVVGVLATVGTFAPYYPPIPAYMYGAYLLLVMAFVAPDRRKPAV